MAKTRPTIASLHSQPNIAAEAVDRLERDIIRLIQLQDEQRTLKQEEGYTDQEGRHPGLRDQVERTLIGLSLFDGVEVEDYIIFLSRGKSPDRVDPVELLRLGVSDIIIKRATVPGTPWSTVTCRKKTASHV